MTFFNYSDSWKNLLYKWCSFWSRLLHESEQLKNVSYWGNLSVQELSYYFLSLKTRNRKITGFHQWEHCYSTRTLSYDKPDFHGRCEHVVIRLPIVLAVTISISHYENQSS